ncbi:MAG: hypothetical protein KDA91_22315, partial [Planctomycetaceae bacterium]|nr:hypothetical protein [Planctomycetaceae bacterium]
MNANHDYRWTVQGLDILMATVTIHCPKCSASLKLADRSMLGRKGKCPKCSHRFVLQEPEEVELTLAEPPAPARPASKAINPPVLKGTSAKWVPDGPKADPGDPPVIPSNSFPTPAADSRRTRQRSTPEIPDPTEINPGVSDTGTA